MQHLLTELLWRNVEIDEAADRLCQTLPGYQEAKQAYDGLAEQVKTIVGYDLYTRYFAHLIHYTNYEVCAYYSLGLGLRKELIQALDM